MDGSDLHIKTDTGRIYVRVHGDLVDLDVPHFTERDFMIAFREVLREQQMKRFEDAMELDFALEVPEVSRFRGNLFRQRGTPQAIFRVIPFDISKMEELMLPELCYELIERPRGLVLVTGPAGSGKSTTLASMIDAINRAIACHIVTVEDPVEFVHDDHVALINQREIDVDTLSFANALKYVLRQDPDVILVGEMRDLETIHLAITAAETGHLVFGTLHTVDALQTVDRIVDVFPQHQQQQIRMQLSVNLLGVISQSLIPRKDKRGRIAAFEVLNCTSAVRNLIRENKTYQISSIIQTGSKQMMQTLDQGLARLVERGLVDVNVARSKAKDPGEFMRIVSLGATTPTARPKTEVKAERHIHAHEAEVLHVAREDAAGAPPPANHPVAEALAATPSEYAEDIAGELDVTAYADNVDQTPPAPSAPTGGNAAHRVVPGQAAPQPRTQAPQPAPQRPAPQAAPAPSQPAQQQPTVVKPIPRPSMGYDPLNEPPGRPDPSSFPKMPPLEKPKKKGFLDALFGSRD